MNQYNSKRRSEISNGAVGSNGFLTLPSDRGRRTPRLPIFLLACAIFGGCASTTDSPTEKKDVPASTKVDQLAETLNRAQGHTDAAKQTVDKLTPENLPAQKPVAQQQIGEVKTDLNEAQGKAKDAGKTALNQERKAADENKKDDARIAELESSNPVRTWFRWIGGVLVVGGVAAGVGAALLRNSTLGVGAVAAAAAGFALLAIAEFLKPILWGGLFVLVGTTTVVAGWAIWRWRANLKALISTQTAIAVINPTEPQRDVLKKIQTADAEATFRKLVKPKVVVK